MSTLIGIQNKVTQVNALAKTNNTLANTELIIPIDASQSITGSFFGVFTLAGAASGAKFQLTVPAGGTIYQLLYIIYDQVTPAVIMDTLLTSASFDNALANAETYSIQGIFNIKNGVTAGNVTLQFAQKTTDAGAATFLAGSWMMGLIN